ncbi:MAG: hypothetical protein A4E52_00243 [Pelotomaculum sp. PtaB.Bin013]|nr:MAG: hypothetical protein A4E52_00243 [Pelotomaculum sp. PtaB.Bin013]
MRERISFRHILNSDYLKNDTFRNYSGVRSQNERTVSFRDVLNTDC